MAELSKKKILWSGSTVLPTPTSLTVSDELIWSSDTGRTLSATMMGDVIAEKKTVSIRWEYITEDDIKTIKSVMINGFFPFSFHDDGVDLTIESYRGTLSKEHLGDIGDGNYYYKTATVDVIQR